MSQAQQGTEVTSNVVTTATSALCQAGYELYWSDQISLFDFDETPVGGGVNSYAGGGASRGCCTRDAFGECQAKFLSDKTETINTGLYGYEV